MQIISPNSKIPFMSYRLVGFILSSIIVAASIFFWVQRGNDKYGLDFRGGAEVVIRFDREVKIGKIRDALSAAGFKDAVVQVFGDSRLENSVLSAVGVGESSEEIAKHDFSIRLKKSSDSSSETDFVSGANDGGKDASVGKDVREALSKIEGVNFTLLKEDSVGAVIGEQIRKDGLTALFTALLIILAYISFRFEFRFAVGAIVALVHDIIITCGLYVASGKEISAAVLAGLLTIVGYSLNDTIIVYDRIRENIEKDIKKYGIKKGSGTSLSDLINLSINQTMSRTILTSLTTFFVVFVLWLFGGGAVADLAFTLVIGVIVGTYSSVFIASPILLNLAAKAKD